MQFVEGRWGLPALGQVTYPMAFILFKFFFFLCFTNTFHMFHSPKDLGRRWLHVRATLTHLSDSFVTALPGAPVLCSNPELPSHPGGLLTAGFLW